MQDQSLESIVSEGGQLSALSNQPSANCNGITLHGVSGKSSGLDLICDVSEVMKSDQNSNHRSSTKAPRATFGNWVLDFVWNLDFGIWTFPAPSVPADDDHSPGKATFP
jgi:hypothetical protein